MVKLIHLMRRARHFRHRSRAMSQGMHTMGGRIMYKSPRYLPVVKKPSTGWFGFGRRRRRRGGSLMPAGGALNPVGFSRMRMRNLPMNY